MDFLHTVKFRSKLTFTQKDEDAYPMNVTVSQFSALEVQMAILSPLARIFITLPQISRLKEPKLSPMRHKSCQENKVIDIEQRIERGHLYTLSS